MLRIILVTIAGLTLSVFVACATTLFMLRHTEFGRLMTGDSPGMADRWQVLMTGG